MKILKRYPFLAKTTGDGGGDGGGGSGSGDGGGSGGEEGALSEDALKLVDERVNKAVSTHLSRFRTSFEKDITKSFSGMLGPISEKLELALTPKEQEVKKGGDEVDARFAELKAQSDARIKALEEENRATRESAAASETKRKSDEEKNALTSVLADAGITGARARAAIALIYTEDKRVVRDEENNILFTIPRAGYVDKVPLVEGVREWMATDDGKAFIPPRAVGGSGGKGSAAPNGAPGAKSTKEQKMAHAKMVLAQSMGVIPGE